MRLKASPALKGLKTGPAIGLIIYNLGFIWDLNAFARTDKVNLLQL